MIVKSRARLLLVNDVHQSALVVRIGQIGHLNMPLILLINIFVAIVGVGVA